MQRELAEQKFREGVFYQHAAAQERMRGNTVAYFLYTVAANQRFQEAQFLNAASDSNYRRFIELSEGEVEQIATAAQHSPSHCDTKVHHRSDPDTFGSGRPNTLACEWNNHWIAACDRHVDGHRVRAWFVGSFTQQYGAYPAGWAPSRSCHSQGIAYAHGNILRYRVCVEEEGCSPWREP
jgi:hypothetical protein